MLELGEVFRITTGRLILVAPARVLSADGLTLRTMSSLGAV